MRKELSSQSLLRQAKIGILVVLALAAATVLLVETESALEASGESEDPRLVLSEALAVGDQTLAASALEAGADPSWAIVDAARREDVESLRWLFERGAAAAGRPGTRALLWALRSEDPELAAMVREHGGELDATDPAGVTLLMSMAAAPTKQKRAYHILSALLDAGADVNARSRAGRTALMLAVKADRMRVIRRLLEAGAEVDARDQDGWTPLILAARDGRSRTVAKLLEAGADSNAVSDSGWTALMWAAWHGHVPVVERLLAAGADPNRSSYAGGTALIRAVQAGRPRVVAQLIAAGADRGERFAGLDATEWARLSGRRYLFGVLRRLSTS